MRRRGVPVPVSVGAVALIVEHVVARSELKFALIKAILGRAAGAIRHPKGHLPDYATRRIFEPGIVMHLALGSFTKGVDRDFGLGVARELATTVSVALHPRDTGEHSRIVVLAVLGDHRRFETFTAEE